jgi:predicted nucleic acid-binding Zn ribbon protein
VQPCLQLKDALLQLVMGRASAMHRICTCSHCCAGLLGFEQARCRRCRSLQVTALGRHLLLLWLRLPLRRGCQLLWLLPALLLRMLLLVVPVLLG